MIRLSKTFTLVVCALAFAVSGSAHAAMIVVAQLGILGITFDENSTVQYVFGTSTQSNALNQDLAGPNGGTTSSLTWDQLGAISLEYSASGTPVPEPSTAVLLGVGLVSLAAARRAA